MLKETQRGREYRMDAAQDCLTVSLLCLMAPCRKPERQHCTTLYGLLTRPHCTWWTSSCRTGTFLRAVHTKKPEYNCTSTQIGFSCSCELHSCQNFLKHTSALEGNYIANNSFVETCSFKCDLCVCCEPFLFCASVCKAVEVQRKA